MKKIPDFVRVEWEDTTGSYEWASREQAENWEGYSFDCRVFSVGYLLREADDHVIIAARISSDGGQVGMVERIPRPMVKQIDRLMFEKDCDG